MLLGMSKTPKPPAVWEKPRCKTGAEKVSEKTRQMWQMWRIDNLLFEIPPEPQAPMKLDLCGFSGYAGIMWATGWCGTG
jgi:hypothetical protein